MADELSPDAVVEFNEHAVASGTAGLAKHRQPLPAGPRAEPIAYTPPKYGPPPGYPAEKWRTMSRKDRREALKNMVRATNKVIK